jgi:hypothetical protein
MHCLTTIADEHPSSIYAYPAISNLLSNLPIKLVSSRMVKLHRNKIPTNWCMGHKADTRHIYIIEYLTGNALHSFHWCPFIPTKSYDFPAILLFNDQIPMLFWSLIQSHYESLIFNSMIGTLVAYMDISFSFLVVIHIMFLVTIAHIFCFTGFIFLVHFSHWVSVLTSDFCILRLL